MNKNTHFQLADEPQLNKKIKISAPTMALAFAKVRKELGPDALILESEEKAGEVVLTAIIEKESKDQADSLTPLKNDEINEKPNEQLHPFTRSELKTLKSLTHTYHEPLLAIHAVCDLCEFHQLGDEFAEAWLESLNEEFKNETISLSKALSKVIQFSPHWLSHIHSKERIVLVGPPGSGKTVLAAKLTANLIAKGHKVKVLSLDTHKVTGSRQLEHYLKPLNVPLRVGMQHLVTFDDQEDEVLIVDTPSIPLYSLEGEEALAQLELKAQTPLTLVLPCEINPLEAENWAKLYSRHNTKELITTRFDNSLYKGSPLRAAFKGLKLLAMTQSSYLDEEITCPSASLYIDELFFSLKNN